MSARIIITKETPGLKDVCILCKNRKCIVDHYKNVHGVRVYKGRITRSISRFWDYINNFAVIEAYRSMPLLGDEWDIPNWDVHVVHYCIVFLESKY